MLSTTYKKCYLPYSPSYFFQRCDWQLSDTSCAPVSLLQNGRTQQDRLFDKKVARKENYKVVPMTVFTLLHTLCTSQTIT